MKRMIRSALCDVLPLQMPTLTVEYLVQTAFAFSPTARFVQVGAYDGVSNDPIAQRLRENPGWSGLSIEPIPDIFRELIANRGESTNYKYANVAVGTQAGELSFYSVDPNGDDDWLRQVSSFDRAHVERHIAGRKRCRIVEHNIQVQTFDAVLRDADIARYDLLVIDAEGHDLEILRQAVPTLSTCRMVIIEVDHLSGSDLGEAKQILANKGFTVFHVGGDYAAIRSPDRWIRVGYRDAIVL